MRIRILIALLFIGQFSFGQEGKHIKVSGTKCSIIPPEGFVIATSFSGFQQNETGASIMLNELPGPYQSMSDGFTAEALKSKGMTLLSKEIIGFNNSKATLVKVSQPANGTIYFKQILLFGDEKNTVIVNGIYPESSKNIEGKIKEALLSTTYNSSQNDDPLEAAGFIVNTDGTDFKVAKYISGSLVFSTDGQIPTEKPTFIVGNSLTRVSFENQKQYAEERLKKLPRGELNVIRESKEVAIDNLKGYEIVANGKDKNNKPELVYQVVLFEDKGGYFIMVGKATEEFEKHLASFRSISKTFKRKK